MQILDNLVAFIVAPILLVWIIVVIYSVIKEARTNF